jgi:hypothetical protein
MKLLKPALLLTLALAANLNCQIAPAYTVAPIPAPSGTSSFFFSNLPGFGINNAGQVVGAGFANNIADNLVFVGNTSATALVPQLHNVYDVYGINNSGQFVGNTSQGGYEAFIGTPTGPTQIPVSSPWVVSQAFGINDAGQVAGTVWAYGNTPPQQAFVGTTSGITLVPLPSGWSNPSVSGINNNGQVVGTAQNASGTQQVFIGTTAGSTPVPVILEPASGGLYAYAINNSGQVVGWQGSENYSGQVFVATTSGVTWLPRPPGATANGSAMVSNGAISGAGVVVGDLTTAPGSYAYGYYGPWIWDSIHGAVFFFDLVPAPWVVTHVQSITDTGLILAQVSNNGGVPQWSILTPVAPCVTTLPSSGISLSAGAYSEAAFNVTAPSGCDWHEYADASWLTLFQLGGTGNGSVSYSVDANPTGEARTGNIWVGAQHFTVSQAGQTVAPVSASIGGVTGYPPNLSLTVSDPNGPNDLSVVDVLINDYLDGQNACYFAFVPSPNSSGYLYLVNDAGNGYVGPPIALYSGQMLSNSQCTLLAAVDSRSGNTLTLTVQISCTYAFAGNRIVYTAARSATQNSGWHALNTWTVAGSTNPLTAVESFPFPATTNSGTFSFNFNDSSGWQDLAVLDVLTNDYIDGEHACYVAYVPSSATDGYLYLVDDAGDGHYVGPPILISSGGTLSNSQCTVNAAASSTSVAGNTLTLNLSLTFSQSFAGNRIFFLAARNNGSGNSGWQAVGTVAVP